MIVYKIENRSGDKCFDRYNPGSVRDVLFFKLNACIEEAINAENWCEIAHVGSVYQGENFRITVEEE